MTAVTQDLFYRQHEHCFPNKKGNDEPTENILPTLICSDHI